jgi:hypothetical protein
MTPPSGGAAALQAGLFDFALGELVRQHRESFPPLWTTESWAKLMIWLALNSGCSGDREALEGFAAALGPMVCGRMRRLFFERERAELNLKLMADPAETQVLAWPLEPGGQPLDLEAVAAALEAVGLKEQVVGPEHWQVLEDLVALPWRVDPCA